MKSMTPKSLMDRRDEIVLGIYALFVPMVSLATMLHAG
mgnify:CR=1 FL=1